jgi:hypothetical protein
VRAGADPMSCRVGGTNEPAWQMGRPTDSPDAVWDIMAGRSRPWAAPTISDEGSPINGLYDLAESRLPEAVAHWLASEQERDGRFREGG